VADPAAPVQLSVRLPAEVRDAVADAAHHEGVSVTAFVVAALDEAVRRARDPFAGLAADLAADLRAELTVLVESGAYAEDAGSPGPT